MDPLSDLLSLLKPRNYMSAGFDAAGDWAVRFPDQQGTIKAGAVVTGSCWLSVEGQGAPVRLETGDCFLLPQGRPFQLASDPAVPAVNAATIFGKSRDGGIAAWNGGGECFLISSRFALDGRPVEVLLRLLPAIVHIRQRDGQPTLRWPVERMMEELSRAEPGGVLILQHLAHMLLVQALRLQLGQGGDAGWLAALAHPQIGAAISAMHADPARRWTLQELASSAGMSRSSFAEKFRQTVGAAPMEYLTRWRMLLAADRLRNSVEPVSAISLALGYDSESAFSTAFRRATGQSPRQFARTAEAA